MGHLKTAGTDSSTLDKNRYIVVFKNQLAGIANSQQAQQAINKTNAVISELNIPSDSLFHQYKWASQGFAGRFTPEQVEKLRKDPRIDHVAEDYYYKAIQTGPSKSSPAITDAATVTSQTIPWGVTRVGGPLDGTGKTAWILDSGVDLDHPDLNVDVNQSTSYVTGSSADDGLGHGTYVAGIIAAKDNASELVGVAAGATVVAVRVCDDSGGCWVSDVKAGVEYAAGNFSSGDVVNLSLRFPTDDSDPHVNIPLSDLETSITNAANSGLKFTIAAGNDEDDGGNYSPARIDHSNVWTVSAYREGDEFAQQFDCGSGCNAGSNYGNPPIDFSAPGEDVPSLRIGGGSGMGFPGTGTEDGTSYAAPHLAGLLLADPYGINTDGTVSNDPDGDPDPIVVAIPLPLEVFIDGPHQIQQSNYYTFEADASGGTQPYDYQWQADYSGTGNGPWQNVGGNSSVYTHISYNSNDFYLRVIVTDDTNDTQTSALHSVTVN